MRLGLRSLLSVAVAGLVSATSMAADIVDTAVSAGKFNTLAKALQAAELVDTLKGEGPFTVFAPTDEAFAKVPQETLAALLKPENKGKLTGVLTYHVVPGKVMAKQVVGLNGATTVNGQRIDIKTSDEGVMVDNAKVITTDIACDNGVIHVIDSVILPESKTIPEVAQAAGKFGTLLAAAKAASLAKTLGEGGPFTVFAPTDEAFGKLPEGTVQDLLKPENKSKLVDILKYHVVKGRVYSEDAVKAKSAATLQGSPIGVSTSDAGAFINKSKLVMTDIDASNGVIHVIDSVLMPPAKDARAKAVIENAVAEGAALFNSGHHDACAKLYETTMESLMSAHVSGSVKAHMKSVLTNARHQTCSTERAWTLRHGIDQTYARLSH